jgi:hypothetical protein
LEVNFPGFSEDFEAPKAEENRVNPEGRGICLGVLGVTPAGVDFADRAACELKCPSKEESSGLVVGT